LDRLYTASCAVESWLAARSIPGVAYARSVVARGPGVLFTKLCVPYAYRWRKFWRT